MLFCCGFRCKNGRYRFLRGNGAGKLLNPKSRIFSAFVIGAIFITGQAKANVYYNWSMLLPNDPGSIAGSGLFSTAAPIGVSTQLLTFTGIVDGIAITALLAPGHLAGNDNLISNTSPYLTHNGLSFSLASNDPTLGNNANLFYYAPNGYTIDAIGVGYSPTGFTYSPVPTGVPEPASIALMVTALAGLATVQFRGHSR